MVDVAVIGALQRKVFDKSDFMMTENYNIRLRPISVEKRIKEVNAQFTSKVEFKGKYWEWGYTISQKVVELADYLLKKRKNLDFTEPKPILERSDSAKMREAILNMAYAEWNKMGNNKGTLHYLKHNAKIDEPFQVYGKVKERLKAE